MSRYLIDTNIIIDYFRKRRRAVEFLESLEEIVVSVVSVGEIYQGLRNKQELKFTKDFLAGIKILPIDEQISDLSLELLENYTLSHGLLILDTLIAATAIRHNLTLATGNLKHFEMIKKLKIEKW